MKIFFRNKNNLDSHPLTARADAFKRYFFKRQFSCIDIEDLSLHQLKKFLDSDSTKEPAYAFISMPPFRGWDIFFQSRIRVILDIRDGWSIAMKSGYGGTTTKKPAKAWVASNVERWAIRRSFICITCTNGLQQHLEKISHRPILLIPNGISDDDIELVGKYNIFRGTSKNTKYVSFACSGQFSEYGADKVKKLFKTIIERYGKDRNLLVRLVGSNAEKNAWVIPYFRDITCGTGSVEILPRMERSCLFDAIASCDYGLSIVRDPDYEFGTKIFDYIALGLPIVNYFDAPNNFTRYFNACLDVPFEVNAGLPEIRRSALIEKELSKLEF